MTMTKTMTKRTALSLLAGAALLPSAAAYAQAQDQAQTEAEADDDVLSRDSVWHDPDIPVLGNPDGNLTVVEYFDYQCPICKVVHPGLSRAIREDGKVRLVSRSWPIFGGASVYAARIALAARYPPS